VTPMKHVPERNHASAVLGTVFGDVLRRLEELVDRESEDLEANDLSGLEEYSRKKDRLLLDLNRSFSQNGDLENSEELLERVRRLQEKLARNRMVLERQLSAAQEFSGFLQQAIRRHETDGTYSRSIGRRSAAR